MARVSGVLIDLGGVVYVGEAAIPGAVEAVARLRRGGMAVRFLTHPTRRPLRALGSDLGRLGLAVQPGELFTPALAARHVLAGRAAHLLVHPDLREDFPRETFEETAGAKAGAVVVGDAGEGFSYAALNAAFRALEDGAELIALAANRSFRDADGGLSLDAGPFVAALEFASRKEARVIGKPAEAFFQGALDSLGVTAGQGTCMTAMVGDDVESDVGGAMAAGLVGVLVRTGKYRDGDEGCITPAPSHVAADLAAAADWLLEGSS